jgi:hypothetical protein
MENSLVEKFLSVNRCTRDLYFEHRITKETFRLSCVIFDPLIDPSAHARVYQHRVILSPVVELMRCSSCSQSLTGFTLARRCERCLEVATDFLSSHSADELFTLYESADVDPVVIAIYRDRSVV